MDAELKNTIIIAIISSGTLSAIIVKFIDYIRDFAIRKADEKNRIKRRKQLFTNHI